MKKLIILLALILSVSVLAGCQNEEKQDVTAMLYDYSTWQEWQLTSEEASALQEYFSSLPLVEDNIKEVNCPYKIVFSDGNTYCTDGEYLEWTDGENSGAVELKDKANGFQVLLINYIDLTESEKEYSLSGDPIILYQKTGSDWQKTVLRYRAAQRVCEVLVSEELANVGVPGENIVLYLDFGNGTILEVFKNEIANIYINADSKVFEADILSGNSPITKLKLVENRIKLPEYTLASIMEVKKNPTEKW